MAIPMNPYGRRAMDHLARSAPDRLAEMADPDGYFAELGEMIAEQVPELEQSLAGPAPAGEDYPRRRRGGVGPDSPASSTVPCPDQLGDAVTELRAALDLG